MAGVTRRRPRLPLWRPETIRAAAPYLGAAAGIVVVVATGLLLSGWNPVPASPPATVEGITIVTPSVAPPDLTTTTFSRLGGFGWNVPTGPIPSKREEIVDAMVGDRGVTPENPWALISPTELPVWEGAPTPTRTRLIIRTSGFWTGRVAWLFLLEEDIERPVLVTDDAPLDPEETSIVAVRFETEPENRSCIDDENGRVVATIHGAEACLDRWGQLVWEESATLITVWWREGSLADVAEWLDTWATIFSNGAQG